jgi:predicted MFS family arabinose efflux permease
VWLFVGDAATSLLFGLVAWFALPVGLRGSRAESSSLETLRVLRRDHRLRQVVSAALLVGLVFVQLSSTFSLEITRSGFSDSTYGLMLSLNGALVVCCELPLTTVTRRYPPRRMMALGFTLIGLGFATNVLPRTILLLVLTTALFTLGEMVSIPVSNAYVADLAPPHQRGLYMGTYGLVWAVAVVFGPSLGMTLFSLSPTVLWSGCAALGVLAAMIISARTPVPSPLESPPGVANQPQQNPSPLTDRH